MNPETPEVRDARPPAALLRALNPMMRLVLPSAAGRLAGSVALLDFTGRRSGRRRRVPVGWYPVDGGFVVFTPAPWRESFRGGRKAVVHHLGRALEMTGTLDTDGERVAAAIQMQLDRGLAPRMLGLSMPAGHRVSADDVDGVHRALIRFAGSAATTPD